MLLVSSSHSEKPSSKSSRYSTRLALRIYIYILFLLFLSTFFPAHLFASLRPRPNFYRDVAERFTNHRIIIPLFSRILPRQYRGNFSRARPEFTGRQTADSDAGASFRRKQETAKRKRRKESAVKKRTTLVHSVNKVNDISDRNEYFYSVLSYNTER